MLQQSHTWHQCERKGGLEQLLGSQERRENGGNLPALSWDTASHSLIQGVPSCPRQGVELGDLQGSSQPHPGIL